MGKGKMVLGERRLEVGLNFPGIILIIKANHAVSFTQKCLKQKWVKVM